MPRTVIGDLAATIDVDHRSTSWVDRPLVRISSFAGGERRRVFQQQYSRSRAADNGVMDPSLQLPGLEIVDEVVVNTNNLELDA
ncbi:hypothetical protein GCM10023066_46330 [Nocardioides kongjuensis]